MRLSYPSWADQVVAWNEFTKGSFGGQWTAPMIGPETPTFMGLPHAKGPEELEGKDAVIIGAPYVASSTEKYAGVDRMEWLAAPQRGTPTVHPLPVRLHPRFRPGRLRVYRRSRLRRRLHPRGDPGRPIAGEHSPRSVCSRGEG